MLRHNKKGSSDIFKWLLLSNKQFTLFSIINDKGKQQILTLKKLEPANQLNVATLAYLCKKT